MAKNIKAIKCPNCGSIKKTEIKTDHFRCQHCDTEYFLDNDDINININHTPYQGTPQLPSTKKNKNAVVMTAILVVLTLFMVINFLVKNANRAASDETDEVKYDYYGGKVVYQNTNTGKAVFLRMGREAVIDKDNNVDFVNTHAVFIDPVSKKQFKDDMIFEHTRRLDDYQSTFEIFQDGTIYMIYPGEKIFTVDRKNDKLVDVTRSLFSKHPEMSSGIADISLSDNYFNLMSNDGHTYYYVPKVDLLTKDYDSVKKAIYSTYPDHWFEFDKDQLMKITSKPGTSEPESRSFLPDREFFMPKILYQDAKSLIIVTHSTAKTTGPVFLQSLNVETGKIIWTQPANMFYYKSAAKCKEGFAFEYSSAQEHDYISGVLIISPEGKVVSDYLLKNGE